ncbi:calponin homology domain-containing protein DDB_G0272472-like [Liolophura sinensis]|uniref:calponin homology domain-containing protein DDB_G0272472-like n=1 Tax=Liolophura sinensis TaxID=3198878 RepID=UPI0031594CAA
MDRHTERKQYSSLDIIERLLDKTTLTTQRVTHGHIIDIGEGVLRSQTSHVTYDNQKEIDLAVETAKKKAAKELQVALRKLREDLELDKKLALQTQKEYYEKRNKRVAEQRDRAEEERVRELTKKYALEKDLALKRQFQECEEAKRLAVMAATKALKDQMFEEFAEDQRLAVAAAVAEEKERALQREKDAVDRMKWMCEQAKFKELEIINSRHQKEVNRLNDTYKILQERYMDAFNHCRRIERDFKELQDDYKRFMDYTDGKFHSDYLMNLRRRGLQLANKEILRYIPDEDIAKLLDTDVFSDSAD